MTPMKKWGSKKLKFVILSALIRFERKWRLASSQAPKNVGDMWATIRSRHEARAEDAGAPSPSRVRIESESSPSRLSVVSEASPSRGRVEAESNPSRVRPESESSPPSTIVHWLLRCSAGAIALFCKTGQLLSFAFTVLAAWRALREGRRAT